jgi:hypothetical protein
MTVLVPMATEPATASTRPMYLSSSIIRIAWFYYPGVEKEKSVVVVV